MGEVTDSGMLSSIFQCEICDILQCGRVVSGVIRRLKPGVSTRDSADARNV